MNMFNFKAILTEIKLFFAPKTASILRDLAKVEAKIEAAIAKTEYEMDAVYSTMSVLDARIDTLHRELDANYKLLNQVNVATQ